MKKENCFTDRLKENKRVVIKNKCHSKPRPLPLGRAPQGRNAGSDDGALESHRFLKRQQGETLNQVQGDGPVYYNNKAFTLIELLVVVLIIGILAAVALPQYQKVVWKSRGTQLIVAVKALHEAQKACYLANGTWATTFDELSIDMPFQEACSSNTGVNSYTNSTYTDCKSNKYGFVFITRSGNSRALFNRDSPKYRWSGFFIYETEDSEYQDELLCTDISWDSIRNSFCALMGWNTKISCNNQGVCTYRK